MLTQICCFGGNKDRVIRLSCLFGVRKSVAIGLLVCVRIHKGNVQNFDQSRVCSFYKSLKPLWCVIKILNANSHILYWFLKTKHAIFLKLKNCYSGIVSLNITLRDCPSIKCYNGEVRRI